MRRTSAFAFLTVALFAGAARGDLLPDGYRPVELSIHVEADVPAGQALILAHTFRAIDVIRPGAVARVEWHPSAGRMVLMSVPASSLTGKVEEQRQSLDRKPLQEIEKSGKPCHAGFDGIRTVPVSAPAEEVRWNYKVTFTAEGCTATLTSMAFFDSSGKPVEGTDVPNIPSGTPLAAPPPATAAAPGTGSPSTSAPGTGPVPSTTGIPVVPSSGAGSPPGAAVPGGACGCEIGPGVARGGAGTVLLGALGLLFAARRRANRRGAFMREIR